MNFIYVHRFIRFLIVISGGIVILLASYYFSSLTYPFLIGWFIAFLMNPIVNFLQVNARLPRIIAVLFVLIFIFSFFIGLLVLFITEIISGTNYLANTLPQHITHFVSYFESLITDSLIPLINEITSLFNQLTNEQQYTIIANINELGANFASSLAELLQNLLTKIPAFLSWFPNAASVLVFTILAAFFISNDWYKLKKMTRKFIPASFRQSGMKVYLDLRKALFGYVRAQLTLIAITSAIVLIGLLILRVDYAIALAFIIGLIDLLPYLGTGIVFIPWIIYEFIINNNSLAIGLSVLFIVIVVQRQIMEPKIVSTNLGINPLATLISVFAGLQLFGFIGLIIGPIFIVIFTTLYKTNVFHNLWSFIKGNENRF